MIDWSATPQHRLILFIPTAYVPGADKFVQSIDYEGPQDVITNAPGCGSDSSTETHKVISSLIPVDAAKLFIVIAGARNKVKAKDLWAMLSDASPLFAGLVDSIKGSRNKTAEQMMQAMIDCKFYILTNTPNATLVETNSDTAYASIDSRWTYQNCLDDLGLTRYSPPEGESPSVVAEVAAEVSVKVTTP